MSSSDATPSLLDGSSYSSDDDEDPMSEEASGDSDSSGPDDCDDGGGDEISSRGGANSDDNMEDESSDNESDGHSDGSDHLIDGSDSPDDDSDGFNDLPIVGGGGSGTRKSAGVARVVGRHGGPAPGRSKNSDVVSISSDESSESDSYSDSPTQSNNGGGNGKSSSGGGGHMDVLNNTQPTSVPPTSTRVIDLTLGDDDHLGVNNQGQDCETTNQGRKVESEAQDIDLGSVSENMFHPLPSGFESNTSAAPSSIRGRFKKETRIINLAGESAGIRHSPFTRTAMGDRRAHSNTDAEVKIESSTDVTRKAGGAKRPVVDLTSCGGSDTAVKEESPAASDELRRQQRDHVQKRSRREMGAGGDSLASQPSKRPRPSPGPSPTGPTGLLGALRYFHSQPSRKDRDDNDSV